MPDTSLPPTKLAEQAGSLQPVGVLLAIVSLLAVVALLHHPIGHGGSAAALRASLREQALTDRLVHGGLAAIFVTQTAAMFVFASRLGAWRFPVALGLASFSCAFVLLVLAAMTDGFLAPSLAEHCPQSSEACAAQTSALMAFGGLQIEYLTRFALVAVAAAVLSWSAAALQTRAVPRWLGLAGLACAALQVGGLLVTSERLSAHNLVAVTAGQTGWYLVVAALMIMGTPPFGAAVPEEVSLGMRE